MKSRDHSFSSDVKGPIPTPEIELSKRTRSAAIASIQCYFKENMPEPVVPYCYPAVGQGVVPSNLHYGPSGHAVTASFAGIGDKGARFRLFPTARPPLYPHPQGTITPSHALTRQSHHR
jgi:hypothetical protein